MDASGLVSLKLATGYERYIGSLIKHLAARCETDDLELYLYSIRPIISGSVEAQIPLSAVLANRRIHVRIAPLARGWHRLGIGVAMQLDHLDVIHFPSPRMATYCPVPSVVTFHDLAALSIESEQTQKERSYLPEALDAGRRATSLIAVSQSAREEVIRYLNRPDVTFIPEGVDASQFSPAKPSEVTALRARYEIDRYVLCVGTLQARKNHIRLIQAFERIQDRVPHTLIIGGRDGSGADVVHSYLASHPNPRVRLIGYVEENQLRPLYTGADALALPSLWEGFGLPLLEAMACGTPVLTSNTSSLREVAADAAVLVDPRDTDDISRGLLLLLTDQNLRERLIPLGLQRAQAFSWDEVARRTIAVYRLTANMR
jgi:glycosyltransferase involved in cell wall biosynthesis